MTKIRSKKEYGRGRGRGLQEEERKTKREEEVGTRIDKYAEN